jgi:hypothetical protein
MTDFTDPLNQIPAILAQNLGIDESELTNEADFRLDFNVTPDELRQLQTTLEETLEISLPDLATINPLTYTILRELIEDAII